MAAGRGQRERGVTAPRGRAGRGRAAPAGGGERGAGQAGGRQVRGSPRTGRGAAGAGPEAAGGSVEKPQRCPGEPCGSPAARVPPAGCRRLRVPVGASPGGAALLSAAAEPTPEALSLEELSRLGNGAFLLELAGSGR